MFLFIRSQLFFIFRRRAHASFNGESLRSSVHVIVPFYLFEIVFHYVGAITLQQKLFAPARCIFFYAKYFVLITITSYWMLL